MTAGTLDSEAPGAPRISRQGDHVRITMARPDRRNALSREHLEQLLAAFGSVAGTDASGIVLAADGLAEPTPAFELIWQLHAAAFALALPALGATFIGAALATHASGLTQPWQRPLGVAGGSLPILAGAGNLAIADGSPLVFAGVLGLAAWLVWLVVTGLRLIRK